MIEVGDFNRPCRIQIEDGCVRPLRRAFRRTPLYRTVFMGFIQQWTQDSKAGTCVTIEDPLTRLKRARVWL